MTSFDVRSALRLYAVTDRSWLGGRTLAAVTEEILAGGATFLQLREKELTGEDLLAEARQLRDVARRYRVPFVVNDDVEAALAADADGVHVGQDDIMGRDIRALIGPDKILGITARTVEAARARSGPGRTTWGWGRCSAPPRRRTPGPCPGRSFGPSAPPCPFRWWPSAASTPATSWSCGAPARRGRRWCPASTPSPIRRGGQAAAGPGGGDGAAWIRASASLTWTAPWWTPWAGGRGWAGSTWSPWASAPTSG